MENPMNIRLVRRVLGTAALCAIAAFGAVGVLAGHQKPTPSAGFSGPADVAGITYQFEAARPLDDVGDAAALQALPARLWRRPGDDVLYAVFVTATNSSDRTQPLARRFELVDALDRRFSPLPLAATSAYRYPGGTLRPGGQAPATGSAVAANLAEQGYPLVFRVPRASYEKMLTLRVFDPAGTTQAAAIVVQS
jgi:hypothetical protein